jgi:hypothetical protein
VSYEACARRLCQVGPYIVAIVDNGNLKCRICAESLRAPDRKLEDFEQALLQETLTTWKKVHTDHTTAWPVKPIQNDIRRVILVTEVDEW